VDGALARLALQGTTLHYTHQNMAELWNAMTRPVARNGLGLTVAEAEREVLAIEVGMTLLPMAKPFTENGDGFVVQHGVLGVQAHDARLAATMYVHGVGHILTLNVATFSRFSGLTVLHPASL
jgi:hypothetical protein